MHSHAGFREAARRLCGRLRRDCSARASGPRRGCRARPSSPVGRRALHLLEALGHVAQDGFANARAAGHEVPELLFVELQEVAVDRGCRLATFGNIGQQGEFAEGLPWGMDVTMKLVGHRGWSGRGASSPSRRIQKKWATSPWRARCRPAFEANLLDSIQAAKLIVFERGEDGRLCAALRRGLRSIFSLRFGRPGFGRSSWLWFVAFQRVARYWWTN